MLAGVTKIALRAALLMGVLALVWLSALLVGRPVGITFAQGAFQFTIDSHATYNGAVVPSSTWDLKDLVPGVDKFFNLSNILPGDQGATTISMHVNEDAWVCLAFNNLQEADNGENEPEDPEDPSTPLGDGELAEGTEFFAWKDDGDTVYEPGEGVLFGIGSAKQMLDAVIYTLADAQSGTPIPGGSTRYVGILWCAGDLVVNQGTGAYSCDGAALGNVAQSDSFSVDLSIQAAKASEQPNFRCATGGEPPPPPPPGLGEQIGLFVKCQNIAQMGWPLPKYKTECPNGFGRNTPQVQNATAPAPSSATTPPRTDRTRPPR